MKRLPFDECMRLKRGDTIFIKCGSEYIKSVVIRAAFWNSDSDEKELEIETDNGFTDLYSIYTKTE